MINFGHRKISTIVISTALGCDGTGVFPYTAWSPYRHLLRVARKTNTTLLGKSATYDKWVGNVRLWNPLTWRRYVKKLQGDGMWNNYGLTNAGVRVIAPKIARARLEEVRIIPNIFPQFFRGFDNAINEIINALRVFSKELGENFWACEVSLSCPNQPQDLCDLADCGPFCIEQIKRHFPWLIVIAKVSVAQDTAFALRLKDAGANIIHGVNSVPDYKAPMELMEKYKLEGGGYSGGPVFDIAYEYNMRLVDEIDPPLILGCGITDDEKLGKYFQLAKSVSPELCGFSFSVCTAVLCKPEWVGEKLVGYNS